MNDLHFVFLIKRKNRKSKLSPHIAGQLVFNKDDKIIQWGKVVFPTNGVGTTGCSFGKTWTSSPSHTTNTKINLKWNTDLDVKAKTIKLIEKN